MFVGIVDWNPCGSDPSSYIVSVDSYVYVHCSGPRGAAGSSYLMQCPGTTAWNPQANGCTDFGGLTQSPPHLIGSLTGGAASARPPHGGVTSTPGPITPPQITAPRPEQSLDQYFAGLPHTLLGSVSGPPPEFVRPPGTGAGGGLTLASGGGGLASQLTVNPCVLDDQGTLSPIRFHRHPHDPVKYLECVPAERSVVFDIIAITV